MRTSKKQKKVEGSQRIYSGRFVVRMLPAQHRQLVERAKVEGVSLNLWVCCLLAKSIGKRPKRKRPKPVTKARGK
jgi:predicted HicB family RNase H-like nuclease